MDESQCPECRDTVGKDAFGAYVIGAAKRLPSIGKPGPYMRAQ